MAFIKTIGKAVISGVEKPDYTVVSKEEGIEERHYPAAKWVSTAVKNISHDAARNVGFKRLFKYITGNNEGDKKIDMTAPVSTKIVSSEGPNCERSFTISFYIPKEHQTEPPQPKDPDVFIEEFPEMTVYTTSFGGYAKDGDFLEHAKILTEKTKDKNVNGDYYYTAGYDSPMKLFNRTNEVWFVKKD